VKLSEASIEAIGKTFPDTCEEWVQHYPELLGGYLKRWRLTLLGAAEGGYPTNQVYFVEDNNGRPLVLKMGHPHPEQLTESIALKAYLAAGAPVARLLDSEEKGYGIVLERLNPGTTLRQFIRDEDAILKALSLHRDLPQPNCPRGLPRFDEWMEKAFAIYRASTDLDADFLAHIERAEALFETFREQPDCMLHGDCHHENILLDGDRWKIIDPKGVIGPAVLEAGRFLHNFLEDEVDRPLSHKDRVKILQRRCELSATVLPSCTEELLAITYIDATLATCWQLTSGDPCEKGVAILVALRELLGE
jgi:streptomycin 6-kinase